MSCFKQKLVEMFPAVTAFLVQSQKKSHIKVNVTRATSIHQDFIGI